MVGRSCIFCGKIPSRLPDHLLLHIEEKPFSCHICKREFTRKGDKKQHEQLHGQLKRFSCSICHKRFHRKGNLTIHTTVHSDDRPYPCSQCSYKAKQKLDLKVHLLIHNDVKKFKCDLCTKRFVTSGRRFQHLRKHTGEKSYKCPVSVCAKFFAKLTMLEDHLRCQHLGEKVHICRKCDKEFGYAPDLSFHKKSCKGKRRRT